MTGSDEALLRRESIVICGRIIDEKLLTYGFLSGCGPSKCTVQCCEGGVYVDLEEQRNILAHQDLVKQQMDETQPRDAGLWFEESIADADFPSGRCVGTRVHGGKCVFLNKDGLCALQRVGETHGLGRWGLKPSFCISYPVTVENGIVTIDDMLSGEAPCCTLYPLRTEAHHALIEVCWDELTYVLGDEGYRQLVSIAKQRAEVQESHSTR